MLWDLVEPGSELWTLALREVRHDFYHLPAYVQLGDSQYEGGRPRAFIARVPLYAAVGGGSKTFLGTVVATGEETPFHFIAPVAPRKLLIDPQLTLLCTSE